MMLQRTWYLSECDDGNTVSGDCCSSTCHVEAWMEGCGIVDPLCGDGAVGVTEGCDDQNNVSGDGRSAGYGGGGLYVQRIAEHLRSDLRFTGRRGEARYLPASW